MTTPTSLTPAQLRVLESYTRLGSQKAVAHELGIAIDAVPPCGWLAYCGRPDGHKGNHGGFRPFLRRIT